MRFGDERESGNFVDDGRGSGGGFGGGGLGCLIPLVFSRFGIGGVIVLVIGYFVLSALGGLGGGTRDVTPGSQVSAPAGQSNLDPAIRHFTLQVLASTEDVWTKLLAPKGVRYTPTTLHFYSESDQSGCGFAQSAMGPFYCPTDKSIYLDTEFFTELASRFQAPGDFAMAYVVAHSRAPRPGPHRHARPGAQFAGAREPDRRQCNPGPDRAPGRLLCRRLGRQCRTPDGQPVLEPGDAEEGMRAAEAIGDDTLQRQTQGHVVPDSFTHGTSAQRVAALRTGLQTGNPDACKL